jgi:hypothetical protein
MKRVLPLVCIILLFANVSFSQLGGFIKKAVSKVETNSISKVLSGPQPISTAFKDVPKYINIEESAAKDGFVPPTAVKSMFSLERTPNGGFILQQGYFGYQAQSYCLHAGTHGPSGGDGYMFAPPLGTATEEVMSVVRNSVQHPNIAQHDIQVLLWAIVARAKFEDLDPQLKVTAAQLLTPKQLAGLNRNALDFVPDFAKESVPEPIKKVLQAEADLRRMLITPGTTYDQLEKVAVLTGVMDADPSAVQVPSGRWSLHPDGYWVRYIPTYYPSTRVEVWVPEGSAAVGKEFDPATQIATPASTGRQRLLQSARPRPENN